MVTLIFVQFGQTWDQIIGKNFNFLKKKWVGGVIGVKKYKQNIYPGKMRLAAIFMTQKSYSGTF